MGCEAIAPNEPVSDQKDIIQEKLTDAYNTETSDISKENLNNKDTLSPDTMFDQTGAPVSGDFVATMTTSMGDIKIRLFANKVPRTVENFVKHATDGYYDGIIFHRVIPKFMIQGGDPTGTGMGGESIYGDKFDDEFAKDLSNIRGSVSMANSGPNTNGSQFFINQVNNSFLDFDKQPLTSKHAVFGQVIEGMEVVDAISAVQTGTADKPVTDVTIDRIIVEQVK